MKGRIAQLWTHSEDEQLRKLAAEGRSSLSISEQMKRSRQSVRNRARRLKIVLAKAQGNFRE
jgi:hypothetical protein